MMCGEQWLEKGDPFVDIQKLKNDLDRLHRERDSFQQQCAAMAEENIRLVEENNALKTALNEVSDD